MSEDSLPAPLQEDLANLREAIVEFHDQTIREDGGLPGLRDENLLELCVARPWMSAYGEDVYTTPYQKAAAIAEAIVCHHAFNDGNHRAALGAAYILLDQYDLQLVTPKDETLDAIRRLESRGMSTDQFGSWLERNCVLRLQPPL